MVRPGTSDGLQGAEIGLLPLCLGGIVGSVGDQGGEVAYLAHAVLGQQKLRQLPHVQPAIGRASEGAVV